MDNNDILRRVRFAMNIKYNDMIGIFALAGYKMKQVVLVNMLKPEDDPDFHTCSDTVLNLFLDGYITSKRGPSDKKAPAISRLNNNLILRKLKIALSMKDTDIVETLAAADFLATKSEINALFQRCTHKNYKECGDQILRNFLVGLTKKNRKQSPKK